MAKKTTRSYRNMQCFCGSGKKYKKCHLFEIQGWVKQQRESESYKELWTYSK